jgi:nitric oxide reductase subunit B
MAPTLLPDAGEPEQATLSPWWPQAIVLLVAVCLAVLSVLAVQAYRDAPPIPERMVDGAGRTLFTGADVTAGQEVFLKHGLMENGTIWGHGAYLGPDFSAEYLHAEALAAAQWVTGGAAATVSPDITRAKVTDLLKTNRYDAVGRTLVFTEPEASAYRQQITHWREYFVTPTTSAGLSAGYVHNSEELRQFTAFVAWTAWASVARRPGRDYSYTNNWPYEPLVGNTPPAATLLWSALSLIALLGGTALVLFAFGRFDYLGWGHGRRQVSPALVPGLTTPAQRALLKYFVIVTLLFLAQVLMGAVLSHTRADPSGFYGLDFSRLLPTSLARTWHLQLAIFWIATAYVGGGLLLASSLGGREPRGQRLGINVLFVALVVVVVGSLLGEAAGINGLLGRWWYWLGDQGWEYLDLGRAWQYLLIAGLAFWIVLLFRALAPARRDPEKGPISSLFLYTAVAIPVFYVPAVFFNGATNFTVVDLWRFWIIHLWVEGFFELFATAMVATLFFQLGLVSRVTAMRVVYLDAVLFLGSGILGTGHHWYWTGQGMTNLGISASFSAMEVIPLTLLTLDAWAFIRLTRGDCEVCGERVAARHRWTFLFLMAVGFWNFVGAGIFGFLINLPIVSFYEVGTVLTPNHAHAAMMGVFGMLAVALVVFALRQALTDEQWRRPEKLVRVAFWGLNGGLALMVVSNLFPAGVLQVWDVLQHGYWHARSAPFLHTGLMHTLEWARLPADMIFIFAGVVPLVLAALLTYWTLWRAGQGGEEARAGE